ncbi:MAG TPA: dienelactone hydrolase family protein [Stellaceae bacterium]|nr:dienelactone hydrolase family protein [Stellaceae bacterium]
MTRLRWLAAVTALLVCGGMAHAQERVQFRSLDAAATRLDGYLFRAPGTGQHPALVFLHGCGGMFNRSTGQISALQQDWATALNRDGYSVLMVDSFTPRGIASTCAPSIYNRTVVEARPMDAYGALYYLQRQPFIRGDRIGLIGWSAGGGTVLMTIPRQSTGRPAALPRGDFRAAVAFYPARCSAQQQPANWTSDIPLLVLVGAADVWTPAAPCEAFIAGAVARGSHIELHVYPDAYHEFDAPDLPVHELPRFRTSAGVVPIVGTNTTARADALAQVPAFLARYLGN